MKNMKKIMVSLLALLLVVTMLPISAVAADTQTASATAPTDAELEAQGWIGISTPEQFLAIKDDNDANYYLKSDINFTDYEGEGTGVYKAQYLVQYFNGTLDGRGKTIKGFEIDVKQNTHSGLFGRIGDGDANSEGKSAVIKNLNLGENTPNGAIKAKGATAHHVNFGFISGYAGRSADYLATIENVNVYGSCEVTATGSNTGYCVRVGGFVGFGGNVNVINSSFNGSIAVNSTAKEQLSIGGIIGNTDSYIGDNAYVIGCNVNATLTAEHTQSITTAWVGGMVGQTNSKSLVVCNNNVSGTYTSTGATGGIVGYIYEQRGSDINCTIAGCIADGGVKELPLYGTKATKNNKTIKITTSDCASPSTDEARNIGDFGNGFDASKNYVWLIDSADDFAKIGAKVDANGTEYTYPLNGYYRLNGSNNIIDMSATVYAAPVVNYVFTGTLDGNGNTIVGLNMNVTGNKTGLFQQLGTADAAATVMNLNIGTSDNEARITTTSSDAGVLAAWGYNIVVSNVDIYADVVNNCTTASSLNFGGFIGRMETGTINGNMLVDCNMFGSLKVLANRTHRTEFGGLVGILNQGNETYMFSGCNNFADLTLSSQGTTNKNDRMFAGGLVGDNSGMTVFSNCANYGTIFNDSTSLHASDGGVAAGGFIGAQNKGAYFSNCVNFGNVSATGKTTHRTVSAGAFGALGISAVTDTLISCDNYGTVTGVISENITLNRIGGEDGKAIDMVDGASVRLAADTGLRFMANISLDAIAKLEEIFGEGATVSYGMLISPNKFIEKANGFTYRALDAYATEENGFVDGEKAYVDIPSVDDNGNKVWFNNQDGKVAGSVTGLPVALYNTAFSGVAYITVTVDGVDVCTLYAADALSRTIYEVAKKALDDVKTEVTTTDDGYVFDKQLEANETYYVDGVEKKVTTEVVYSCYSKTQRDTLNKIVADFDGLAAN